ncbi:MAG: hypothetical protein ABI809_06250 [Caldimonas sp.]
MTKRLRRLAGVFASRAGSGLIERRDPASLRRPEVESDRVLMPVTLKWLELLPEYARPTLFCERFPRIVNQFATVWADRKLCKLYFETLMGDDRGGRTGFGPDVRKEIVRLRVFYETTMSDASAEQDWKQRVAATPIGRAVAEGQHTNSRF